MVLSYQYDASRRTRWLRWTRWTGRLRSTRLRSTAGLLVSPPSSVPLPPPQQIEPSPFGRNNIGDPDHRLTLLSASFLVVSNNRWGILSRVNLYMCREDVRVVVVGWERGEGYWVSRRASSGSRDKGADGSSGAVCGVVVLRSRSLLFLNEGLETGAVLRGDEVYLKTTRGCRRGVRRRGRECRWAILHADYDLRIAPSCDALELWLSNADGRLSSSSQRTFDVICKVDHSISNTSRKIHSSPIQIHLSLCYNVRTLLRALDQSNSTLIILAFKSPLPIPPTILSGISTTST